MNTQELRDEIEKRVLEKLPVALFEKGVKSHAKNSFRLGCSCDFCKIKRSATLMIGCANRATTRIRLAWGDSHYELIKQRKHKIREKLREEYRAKMNDELAGI